MSEKKRKLPLQRRKRADHAGTRTRRIPRTKQRAVPRRRRS